MKIKYKFILIAFLSLAFVKCQTSIDVPAGFASYSSADPFVAVSPDAVQIRVHSTKNQPVGSLAVLAQTAQIHFDQIGYKILRQEDIKSNSGLPGQLFISSVQTMNGELRYLAAFFLDGDRIHIVEAAGRQAEFSNYENEIIQKIKSIKPGL